MVHTNVYEQNMVVMFIYTLEGGVLRMYSMFLFLVLFLVLFLFSSYLCGVVAAVAAARRECA